MSAVTLQTLKDKLDPSLAVYADVILNPSFPATDLERLKRQRLAQIQQEKVDPVGMALRVSRPALRAGHAYSNPWTGTGTEESTTKISREDLVKFHRTWFKPNNAKLIVVGATTMAEIRPKLERAFAGWAKGDVPAKNVAHGSAAAEFDGLSARPSRRDAVGDPGGQRGAPQGESRRARARGDEPGARRVVLRADQHEPAGGQALVVRHRSPSSRRQGPAAVRDVRTGADRQDQGVAGGAPEGAAGHPDRPAADRSGDRHGPSRS